jgi:hypothetical protein
MGIRSSKQSSQAIVEFGLIALLFVALMFATVDFGLLLNTWLAVSSGTREIARNASVGKQAIFLTDEASKLTLPSVDRLYGTGWCCDSNKALFLKVEYFNQCVPGPGCTVLPKSSIDPNYPAPDGSPGTCAASCHPISNDSVQVTLVAQGAQIITPLLRPAFQCTNGSNPKCYVPLTSTAIMRYEGAEF